MTDFESNQSINQSINVVSFVMIALKVLAAHRSLALGLAKQPED